MSGSDSNESNSQTLSKAGLNEKISDQGPTQPPSQKASEENQPIYHKGHPGSGSSQNNKSSNCFGLDRESVQPVQSSQFSSVNPISANNPLCPSSSAILSGASTFIVDNESPPCLIVLGMAGSGKTSFVQRLTSYLHSKRTFPYLVNLDPAAAVVPFPANIDIRDTVTYKAVMKEYGLGPNGAIITCLNLFCTRFNQVLDLLEKRKSQQQLPLIVLDTPGQIEAFTWSASGAVITDALASAFPTMVAYVLDSARSTNPTTFMSNMLYACSILYRTKLPFFLVLNKADVVDPEFAVRWMTDFETFQTALDDAPSCYMNDFTRSLSLVLDSFYEQLNWVAVSSKTGQGFDKVIDLINKCRFEYAQVYRPMCAQLRQTKRDRLEAKYAADRLAQLAVVAHDPEKSTSMTSCEDTNGNRGAADNRTAAAKNNVDE